MVDQEPRHRIRNKIERAVMKVNGLGFLGVAGIGVNRLANGGSVGRAVTEMGMGTVAGIAFTAGEQIRKLPSERVKDAFAMAAVASIFGIGGLGLAHHDAPGIFEATTAVATVGEVVVFDRLNQRKPDSGVVHPPIGPNPAS